MGTKDRMFMSPDIWREFFKEPYRKLYDYLHANDVLIVHHGDSFLEPIAEDMADLDILSRVSHTAGRILCIRKWSPLLLMRSTVIIKNISALTARPENQKGALEVHTEL